jgi:hypothetical protein
MYSLDASRPTLFAKPEPYNGEYVSVNSVLMKL